ncbi:hypothetical protein [Albidovulum sp.]|uniref:hypothetical protein n=1 Tax=Albidovulum sp. TaxID=1872424 RepID=UPI0039B86B02
MGPDTTIAAAGRLSARWRAWPWLVATLCLVPVLAAPVLPLIDFYAHAFRYAILAGAGSDPWLAENYRVAWSLLPNLGLDAIGAALFRVLPPLAAARVVALIAIAAPFAGVLVLARCLHRRVGTLPVALAGILAHSFILGWGFANFLLGLGLALAALGLWIAGRDAPGRQLAVAIPAGIVVFLTHGFVFALWGALLAAVEVALALEPGRRGLRTLPRRALRLLAVAAVPTALFLASATSGGEGGVTGTVGNLAAHLRDGSLGARLLDEAWTRADAGLRVAESGWPLGDRLFGAALWALLAVGLGTGRLRLDRRLRLAAWAAAALVVLVPPGLFGVGHLAERMPLVLLALLAAGLAPARRAAGARALVQAVSVLLPLHLLMVTLVWARSGDSYRDFMAAAEGLPAGSLAAPAFGPESQSRDSQKACKPLSFLLGLDRGLAVPTFADPTQQPLEIVGPLAAAMADYDRRAAAASGLSGTAQVAALVASGFDAVVLCQPPDAVAGAVAGARIIGSGRGWTLYLATPG